MKTDLVEIFQTIRANLQPYTASGFTARVNSDTAYELWSEKLFDANGEKIEVQPFASVSIEGEVLSFCILSIDQEIDLNKVMHPDLVQLSPNGDSCFDIDKIDDKLLDHIINALGVNFTHFKQKGWV